MLTGRACQRAQLSGAHPRVLKGRACQVELLGRARQVELLERARQVELLGRARPCEL